MFPYLFDAPPSLIYSICSSLLKAFPIKSTLRCAQRRFCQHEENPRFRSFAPFVSLVLMQCRDNTATRFGEWAVRAESFTLKYCQSAKTKNLNFTWNALYDAPRMRKNGLLQRIKCSHIMGGTVIPITPSTRMSSRRMTATVASRNFFRPSSASERIGCR